MMFSPDFMPYSPAGPLLSVIGRMRERGLPEPLDLKGLEQVGVPTGNAPKVLRALKFLGLVAEDDSKTDVFIKLAKIPTDQYPTALAEIVRDRYASIFAIVDPSQDSETAVEDAFRPYEPSAQRPKMVAMFLALCREAGIVDGRPRREATLTVRRAPAPRATLIRPRKQPPAPTLASEDTVEQPVPTTGATDYRLVTALMQQLPRDGKWTQSRRDKWLQAFTASLDLLVTIIPDDDVRAHAPLALLHGRDDGA